MKSAVAINPPLMSGTVTLRCASHRDMPSIIAASSIS